MTISVLAVTDQISPLIYDHFRRERWSHVDFVVSCGDLPPDYLDFLTTALAVPLFFVRGNHDESFDMDRYAGFENLHGRVVTYKGIRLAGFEGCRRYNRGTIQYTESQMLRVSRGMRRQVRRHGIPDLVISHAPPLDCNDGLDLCHRGFDTFNVAMRGWKPKYWIHGHAHNYEHRESVSVVDSTVVINAYPHYEFQIPEPLFSS